MVYPGKGLVRGGGGRGLIAIIYAARVGFF